MIDLENFIDLNAATEIQRYFEYITCLHACMHFLLTIKNIVQVVLLFWEKIFGIVWLLFNSWLSILILLSGGRYTSRDKIGSKKLPIKRVIYPILVIISACNKPNKVHVRNLIIPNLQFYSSDFTEANNMHEWNDCKESGWGFACCLNSYIICWSHFVSWSYFLWNKFWFVQCPKFGSVC